MPSVGRGWICGLLPTPSGVSGAQTLCPDVLAKQSEPTGHGLLGSQVRVQYCLPRVRSLAQMLLSHSPAAPQTSP